VITIHDAEIVEASWYWNIQKFSGQMWDPFAAWVSKTYPEDVEAMYEDGQTNFRLSPESIRLWEQHSLRCSCCVRVSVRPAGELADLAADLERGLHTP
jgi:hypothetical protein